MYKNKQIGIVKKLDQTLKKYKGQKNLPNGCINYIRRSLNISLKQLGAKLGLSSQAIYAIEQREKHKNITLKKLNQVANALNMDLLYAFVPKKPLEEMIKEKAYIKAKEVVMRTHQNMILEDQQVCEKTLTKEIEGTAKYLEENISSTLWD